VPFRQTHHRSSWSPGSLLELSSFSIVIAHLRTATATVCAQRTLVSNHPFVDVYLTATATATFAQQGPYRPVTLSLNYTSKPTRTFIHQYAGPEKHQPFNLVGWLDPLFRLCSFSQ
jgi:hypothetical protein